VFDSNFKHLIRIDPKLAELGASAEKYFHSDPNASQMRLRQFEELAVDVLAERNGVVFTAPGLADRLSVLTQKGIILPPDDRPFHDLRLLCNEAVHVFTDDKGSAPRALAIAHKIGRFMQEAVGDPKYRHTKFRYPPVPMDPNGLQTQIAHLSDKLQASGGAASLGQVIENNLANGYRQALELLSKAQEEKLVWEQLALEEQARKLSKGGKK
jgi:type I restriction enzyme, R subunit